MKVFISALLALGVVDLAAAAPSGTSFSVPRQRRNGVKQVSGKAAREHVFSKYGWKLPEAVPANVNAAVPTAYASGGQTASTSATPERYHSEYLSPVTIAGQQLNVDFDSGSSDFWVYSSYLKQSDIGNHSFFSPNQSTTYEPINGARWSISYGDGSGAAGVVGYDKVSVGSATVTRQAVELATALSSAFVADENNDGIFGLGFDSINNVSPTKQKTWFSNIKSSLKKPLWTADLREDGSGSYHFGEIPAGAYTGQLKTVVVNNTQGYWQINSKTIVVNGNQTTRADASPAIADTGTSLLIVDEEVALAWYRQIPGSGYSSYAGGYVYPCSANSTLPSFQVAVGNLPSVDPTGRGRLLDIPTRLLAYAALDDEYCYGAIQSNNGQKLQVYGDILFRSGFFVFFDKEPGETGPTLGVADKGAATPSAGQATAAVPSSSPLPTGNSTSGTIASAAVLQRARVHDYARY